MFEAYALANIKLWGENNCTFYYNRPAKDTAIFFCCAFGQTYDIMRKEKQLDYFSQVVNAANSGKLIPTEPKWNIWVHRNEGKTHCPECLKLDKCWFAKELTPKWPHHFFCHCILVDIPYVNVMYNASAECPYSKFDPYLFNTEGKYTHTKEKLFNSWGYTVDDAKWLQNEIQKQGLEKYISGDYVLGQLNYQGQRINIRIELPRKDRSGIVSFITGWMVEPNGRIRLVTPYGDK